VPPAKRTAFTIVEKAALLKQHAASPRSSQQALCEWFERSFDKSVRQATVSEILSDRYSHLDEVTALLQPLGKKQRTKAYTALENGLSSWFFAKQGCKDFVFSGEVLGIKARFFWQQLPQYQGLEVPSSSDGWLSNFTASSRGAVTVRPRVLIRLLWQQIW
jgi:hypothetical protein